MLVGLIDENGRHVTWAKVKMGVGVFNDPTPVLLALYQDRTPYADFSVTELINDPYTVQLQRRYDYYESPDSLQDRLLGTGVHALMEKAPGLKGTIQEVPLVWTVGAGKKAVTVGGKPDLIVVGKKLTMWDYKTVTAAKLDYIRKGKADIKSFTTQLNDYRMLYFKLHSKKIAALRVRLIVRDWRFYEFRRKGFDTEEYPRGGVLNIKCGALETVEADFRKRLKRHVGAARLSDDKLHTVGECDTWNGLRCEHYCAVNNVCHFRRQKSKPKKGR